MCEKELLATVFAMERFLYYVYGRDVGLSVESDHKPLIAIVQITEVIIVCTEVPPKDVAQITAVQCPTRLPPLKRASLSRCTLSRAYPPSDATDDHAEFTEELASLTVDEQMQQLRALHHSTQSTSFTLLPTTTTST